MTKLSKSKCVIGLFEKKTLYGHFGLKFSIHLFDITGNLLYIKVVIFHLISNDSFVRYDFKNVSKICTVCSYCMH